MEKSEKRRRVALHQPLVTLPLLASFALSLAGCALWHALPVVEHGPTTAPAVQVVRVTDMGVIPNPAGTRGRDGGYSAVFEGEVVWVFGDTILDNEDEDLVSSSWSWTADLDASDGITGFQELRDAQGYPVELLPFTAEESAFNAVHRETRCEAPPCQTRWALWPGAVVPDPERGRALLFYVRIFGEPGPYAFRPMGHSAAVWYHFDEQPVRPDVMPDSQEPTLLFGPNEPSFGGGALAVGNMLYAYACDLKELRKPCRLGRVPLEAALERSAWRFYNAKSEWAASTEEANPVFDGNTILSVFHADFADRFIALYSRPLDSLVVLRTAPHPEGPWSDEIPVFDALRPDTEPGWVYDALAHPEYADDNGRIQYVTYSRATGPADFEFRLVRVELAAAED
jgi:hypothetical protein